MAKTHGLEGEHEAHSSSTIEVDTRDPEAEAPGASHQLAGETHWPSSRNKTVANHICPFDLLNKS